MSLNKGTQLAMVKGITSSLLGIPSTVFKNPPSKV